MRLSADSLRRVVKRDLTIEFVPQQLTSFGGLELLRRYVQRLALPARLRQACAALGGDYNGASLGLLILALLYAGIGNVDAAFGQLERACDGRDPSLDTLAVEPRFHVLHQDRRYQNLVERLKLAPLAVV